MALLRARAMLGAAALAAASLVALALAPAAALAAPLPARAPAPNSPHFAVDLASPAVVRIVSEVQGTFDCHGCATDGTDIISPADSTQAWTWQVSGSGAFITPDGYVLTADHVVDHGTNNSDDYNQLINDVTTDLEQRFSVDQNTVNQFFQNNTNSITLNIQATNQRVFLSTAFTGQLQNSAQVTSYAITHVAANSPINQQDVAILKVEANDLPYLALSNAAVHVQDAVTAIGYPGNADIGDFSALLNPTGADVNTINSLLAASVQSGQVTGQKTLPDGTPVFETSSIGAPGSSGGPVVDQQGRIIGFVDAGSSNGQVVFLIPSGIAQQYVRQSGANTAAAGTFMTRWARALGELDATATCHFTNANRDLASLQTDYPQFGGVKSFLATARANAGPKDCPPPASGPSLGVIGGLLALLLAAGGGGYYYYTRRRAAAMPVPAGVAAGQEAAQTLPSGPPPLTLPPMPGDGAAAPTPALGVPHVAPTPPTTVRVCANGHLVEDPEAQFCPECGARL